MSLLSFFFLLFFALLDLLQELSSFLQPFVYGGLRFVTPSNCSFLFRGFLPPAVISKCHSFIVMPLESRLHEGDEEGWMTVALALFGFAEKCQLLNRNLL
ncbi:hypothetical protein CDAR_275741 [Caerostris darwini]|uniref:Secreted protein n=1 Tax=Caerostris darwini TaxID=1538125 RepID=A0AAV4NIL0_9ARAC|nr:hypothetical protein CDAR_275741 [Caerostris darwini]